MGGFDRNHAILIYEGKILDGRHRYLAAVKAGVDPIFTEFQGTREEAVKEVTKEQVDRGHWSDEAKNFFYFQSANALGVQERGGNGNNQHQSGNAVNTALAPSQQARADDLGVRKREDSLKQNSADPTNVGTVPSAKEHADDLGVTERTVERWEKDRKEIMADPELAEKATTPEAWEYVNDHNGEDGRRMLSKADLQDFYYAWSEFVGVRDKGGANNPEGLGGKSDKASSVIDNRSNGLLSIDSPSQEEFADKLGMSPSTVKRMEADKRKIAANPEVASEVLSRASKGIRLGVLGFSGAYYETIQAANQ